MIMFCPYTGAPDECSYCWAHGWKIVKFGPDGECPEKEKHHTFGPAANYYIGKGEQENAE